METFEKEIVDTYRLFPIRAIMGYAKTAILNDERIANAGFGGILPPENSPSRNDPKIIWPEKNIRPLIDQVADPTVQGYFDRTLPLTETVLNQQLFVLLSCSFDGFLERIGHHGTLGQRYNSVRQVTTIPQELHAAMHEIIQRRNDTAHNSGRVSSDYIGAIKYPELTNSKWVIENGMPATENIPHDYNIKYLFWATSRMYDLAQAII